MKKVFLFLLCFAALQVFAQQVVTYSFTPHKQIKSVDGFSELIIENCSYISEEGCPDLPVFSVSVLLEPGHEIDYLKIKSIEYYPVVEGINIRPASAHFPISKGAPDGYKAVPKPDIYNADKHYPENIVSGENTSFLRGHAVGTFLIYPALYNPVQQRVELIKSITIEIYTQPTPKASDALKFLRNDENTTKRIEQATTNRDKSIIDNYDVLCNRNDNPNYDILIVTKQSFTSALNDYILHKNRWGYKVLVKTVEDIYASYTGIDNAEKVRNCVIDAYTNDGISYLMLFGDSHQNSSSPHNNIPYRKLYVAAGNTIDNLPSDMYFACLDGTWYNSGDGTWGKPGYNDLDHEISVGRICADNAEEIETFVSKLIKYQETPVAEDVKKALMVGEMLNDNPLTWGGDCKDQIKTGGYYNGYTTVGLPSHFSVSTLYERDGWWNTSQLRNYFNNTGAHFVNHLGHSNVTYNMLLSNGDITNNNFTNTGIQRTLSIVYSQGCLNGAFDNINDWGQDVGQDCINEMFHKINGGVVANIGNSRYGWYNPGGTNGPSQRFDRYFFDGIFGQNIFSIGDANSYSKDINKALVQNDPWLRWCCYELNLLGDPSMDIWTDTPTHFETQYFNIAQNSNTELFISTDVPNARVAVLQNNVLLSRGVCNSEGDAILYFDSPFNPATATLSITAHNKYRYQKQEIVFADAPPIRNLTANVNDYKTTLNWQEPDLSGKQDPPVLYAIYRNGSKIATITADNLTYPDNTQLTPNTTYQYCVKAVYSDCSSIPVCLSVTTEPYCVAIPKLYSSVTGKKIMIYWNPPEFPPVKYTVLRDGEFLKETTQLYAIDDVQKENTEYEYCVIANYESCDTDPTCIKVKSGIVCGAIDDITSKVDILSIEISWTHISPNQLVKYMILRDGVITVEETTETSITDTVPQEDTEYHYCIMAFFDKCSSDERCITVKSGKVVTVEEEQTNLFRIYPNPAYDYITVKGNNMQHITIYDITGKIISEINLNNVSQTDISVSGLANGLYLLQIHSEGTVYGKRFAVIR